MSNKKLVCEDCDRSENNVIQVQECVVHYSIGNSRHQGTRTLCMQCAMVNYKYLSASFPNMMIADDHSPLPASKKKK